MSPRKYLRALVSRLESALAPRRIQAHSRAPARCLDRLGLGDLPEVEAWLSEQARREGLSEDARYRLAERLAYAVYPRFLFSEYGRIFLDDEAFLAYYRRFMDPDNWHSYDRKFFLQEALRLVANLPGNLAECGCYQGATAYLMCRFGCGLEKRVDLFDSFAGLSDPGAEDGDYWARGDLAASEALVRQNLAEHPCYRTFPGWIPTRFHEVAEERYCFVHVDVDLYAPTRDSVEFFFPRLVPGGCMLFDDYGFRSCPGAREAVNEYFASRPEKVAMVPTGQALVIKAAG